MTERQDSILTFVVMLAVGIAIAALGGVGALVGFALGVIVTLGAAVVAGTDLD
jgi:hypothetical protein